MTEPILTPAASTLAAATATMPLLSIFGVNLGLRPDLLVAGFSGALAAIILLNSVPASSDTWREMVSGTVHRMAVALASSVFSGYGAPILLLAMQIPQPLLLGVAFITGAGAQKILAAVVRRFESGAEGAPKAPSPDSSRKEG